MPTAFRSSVRSPTVGHSGAIGNTSARDVRECVLGRSGGSSDGVHASPSRREASSLWEEPLRISLGRGDETRLLLLRRQNRFGVSEGLGPCLRDSPRFP